MNRYLVVLGGVVVFLAIGNTAAASEIQYGHVEDVHGEEVHIQYRGPGGEQNFRCSARSTECAAFGTSTPELFPEIDGATDYANSPDGLYGIVETSVTDSMGSTTYLHTLYDISGDTAELAAVVPYTDAVTSYKFPWANDRAVLFGEDGTVATYGITDGTFATMTPSQAELPLRSLSPHAQYLSAYNYVDEAHKIWHTTTGAEISIPSDTPAFVEFSQDERYAAYIDDSEGYQTLYIADLNDAAAGEMTGERVFADDFTVEDYLWYANDLYAVGNTAENPYEWVLYRYDAGADETDVVAENVSYGDYIRPIGEYGLSFLTIDGKNSHVALYDPVLENVRVIEPVEDSPASDATERSVVEFDEAKGVLYAPEDPGRSADLYVWLHGGPKRQTSFGYHSYLSYAVYDELLERLVESGAYVLKLDYAGSYGHGSAFMDALTNGVGVADVAHVVDAAREIAEEYDTDDTYLIGNSYGGYLGPKALVDQPRHFDGAIAINGVFDWFTLLERIPSSPFATYFKGLADLDDLDANFDLYEQASIVKDLPDLNRKELVLIYGEDDATVPTWQTREFFYLAESLDKRPELLKLEGEDHIIRERESLNEMCDFIAGALAIDDLECA